MVYEVAFGLLLPAAALITFKTVKK